MGSGDALHYVLFAFLAVTAIAIIRQNDLFAAVMMMGIFSLLSAALFTVMDAVDVAFTEAAVGAGISTVLMLGTLALTKPQEQPQYNRGAPLALVVVAFTGLMLMFGTQDLPTFGDPEAPIHEYMAPYFIANPLGVPNVVTAVLASYRGYDTWGETTVIFAAALGVTMLLGGSRRLSRRLAQEEQIERERTESGA